MTEFDESVFKFVRKLMPTLKTKDFKLVRNELIVIPNFDIYPIKGTKGNNSPLDDYGKRSYYSVGLKPDGYYKIVLVIEYHTYLFNVRETVIKDVSCKEFTEKFNLITYDLSRLLLSKPKSVESKSLESNVYYCQKATELIENRFGRK